MGMDEKDTRLKLIDPKLERAGWEVLTKKYTKEKSKACIEIPVNGLPRDAFPNGEGFVDYVLFGDDLKPLALIEAKKSVVNEEQGRVQACLYADALEKEYGIRPIIYYTNGYSIKVIDGVYPARPVFGFHKKDELEYLIQRRGNKITDKTVRTDICDRYYQKEAIDEILKHLGKKKSRSLIVLATGTGKTRVSCALSDIFIRNNFVKRVLFLADRKNLVNQAKEETFEKFINAPMAKILDGHREGDDNLARIVFSTYQSMLQIIKDTSTCPYGIGHFDLIIIDEAHRSLFNKYAEIFDYFDALMIGLTATPRNDINKSTYKVFNLDDTNKPNYEYEIYRGVKDGYLTYYRALDRTPKILKDGLTYDKLSDEEKEQYAEKFTDDDGTLPAKIEGKRFISEIYNEDTIRTVLKDLMEEGIKVKRGNILGKTIIFARDHKHAILIQKIFREMFPDLCLPNNPSGVDYCVVIDNKIKFNEVLQREFKNKQNIRIVISVDMMDTGVDIPELVNLVFFKRVLSKIKFTQMIGRGTRVCKNINAISPSEAYFERTTNDGSRIEYKDKQGFLIFDICNVFPFFKLNPDGKVDRSEQSLSLSQKIFMEKVSLLKAMQHNFSKLSLEDKKYYEDLKLDLLYIVKDLNRNYIGVQIALKEVEKYSNIDNWYNLTQDDFIEIKKKVAPNVIGEIDFEGAEIFDYICFKFATARFNKNKRFAKIAKALVYTGNYLIENKSYIDEVQEHMESLRYISSNAILDDTSVTKVDEIRCELRYLTRYIEEKDIEHIISDFKDEITNFTDADESLVDFKNISIEDFKTLEQKASNYIEKNSDDKLVFQIHNLIKPTNDAIEEFKNKMIPLAKTADEFNTCFKKDEDVIKFVRQHIELNPTKVNEFLDNLEKEGFNRLQVKYAKELLLFISQNGFFNKQDLLREELNFNGIFDSNEIQKLLKLIERRI